MAVLTTAGNVETFEHALSGITSKKPIKSSCCIKISTAAGRDLPVLACNLSTAQKLLLMYNTALCPAFETLELVRNSP